MAVLAFLSCGNGSYMTPNVEGLLGKRRKAVSQQLHQKVGRASIIIAQHAPETFVENRLDALLKAIFGMLSDRSCPLTKAACYL